MTTQLGIGTYAYAWSIGVPGYEQPENPMRYHEFLQAAVNLSVSVAQIADNLPLHTLSDSERVALKAFADENGITLEVGTRGIQPEHLRTYLDIAQEFDSAILRVVVDTTDHHPDVPEIIDILRGMLPEFKSRDITLAIENHDRFKARDLVTVLEAVDSTHVGICMDTVNSFGSLEGPEVVVAHLGKYVVNLHVKDFSIRRIDHNMGFLLDGTPAGAGMLDVPWMLEQLNQHGRDYNAIIELWPAPEATMQQTMAKERQWAQQSVSTMRQWIKD
ncbi:MAG: TIM barrel protein [Chloroflexota bacterium]